jgi:acyl-CoA thioester hydrolase
VRYGECDAQQVVFNARYVDYVDVAFTEFTRVIWGGYASIIERGVDSQVVNITVDWSSSAVFDDVISIEVECERLGNTSFSVAFSLKNYDSGQRVAEAKVVYVMVDTDNFRKCTIPEDLRKALLAGAPDIVIDQAGLTRAEMSVQ